jgi:hypothetical protein
MNFNATELMILKGMMAQSIKGSKETVEICNPDPELLELMKRSIEDREIIFDKLEQMLLAQ